MKLAIYLFLLGAILTNFSYSADLNSFICTSSDGKELANVNFSDDYIERESTIDICSSGGLDTPMDNCHQETTHYKEFQVSVDLKGEEFIRFETKALFNNDWFFNVKILPKKGYEIDFRSVKNQDRKTYQLWIRVFQGQPYKTTEINRIKLTCTAN